MNKERIIELLKQEKIYPNDVVDIKFKLINNNGDTIDYQTSRKEKIRIIKQILRDNGFELDNNFDMFDSKYEKGFIFGENTYNYESLIPIDLECRLFNTRKIKYNPDKGKFLLAISPHEGMDIRSGYVDTFVKYDDDKNMLIEEFYNISRFALSVYITFSDESEVFIDIDDSNNTVKYVGVSSGDDNSKAEVFRKIIDEVGKNVDIFKLFNDYFKCDFYTC